MFQYGVRGARGSRLGVSVIALSLPPSRRLPPGRRLRLSHPPAGAAHRQAHRGVDQSTDPLQVRTSRQTLFR